MTFDQCLTILKAELGYVEDKTFSWDTVSSILVIPLTNTDSLIKNRSASNATQIQLTSGVATGAERPTEDFFPTLTINKTFPFRRIRVDARINIQNIIKLNGRIKTTDSWVSDTIQIRRRELNESANPCLHICYGDDLIRLRNLLKVGDYLVIVNRENSPIYEAFGLPSTVALGNRKQLLTSNKATKDSTVFPVAKLLPPEKDLYPKVVEEFVADSKTAGIIVERELATRFLASLLSKRLLILTGLSGSGKTKVAQAFSSWISESGEQVSTVAVGADWTSNENVLGYPDALDEKKYITKPALELILKATDDPDKPYFLILDEMNLSHVERYLADILSAIESGKEIFLHSDPSPRGAVPPLLKELPHNLFIIGTVNVDETTYIFSPKVLDRSNVIEFRIDRSDMKNYVKNPSPIELDKLAGAGAGYGTSFVSEAKLAPVFSPEEIDQLKSELMMIFDLLTEYSSEFGFRSAGEMRRFIYFHKKLTGLGWDFSKAMDLQILQKLLPKLHGSYKNLAPLLKAMGSLCYDMDQIRKKSGPVLNKSEVEALLRNARDTAYNINSEQSDPIARDDSGKLIMNWGDAHYKLSFEKIQRMLLSLDKNGFTSFAEA